MKDQLPPQTVETTVAAEATDAAPMASPLLARKLARRAAQRRADGDAGAQPGADAAVARADSSTGAPLPTAVRSKFEGSLGADLGGVRVHTGEASAEAAKSVGARAYATGNDIHFAQGAYDPGSSSGQELLAHEVAHTVQQQGAPATTQHKLELSSEGDASEHEADRAASAMVQGAPAGVSPASGVARKIARKEEKKVDLSGVDADDNGEVFEFRDALIHGTLADQGDYKDGKFVNATLETALRFYGDRWGIDVNDPPPPPVDGAAATTAKPSDGAEDKKDGAPPAKGGDFGPSKVKGFPKWFEPFQSRLTNGSAWGKDQQAVAAMLNAFLRKRFDKAPANVQALFGNIGTSKDNKQNEKFLPGSSSYNWCAAAGTKGVVDGLLANGLEFKNGMAGYTTWLTKEKGKGRQVNPPTSYTQQMDPGDKFTLISNQTPMSGHVATVVEMAGDAITFVSGNAGGGHGSVRIDQAIRETPPAGYNFGESATVGNEFKQLPKQIADLKAKIAAEKDETKKAGLTTKLTALEKEEAHVTSLHDDKGLPSDNQDSNFKAGVHAPKDNGRVWVIVIEKASQLDGAALKGKSDAELAPLGIQHIKAPGDKSEKK